MEQFVWSMEEEPVKDLFRYVLMESGAMCVDMAGLPIMQELCVANWDTLQQVQNHRIIIIMYLFSTPVYSYSYSLFTGVAPQPIVYMTEYLVMVVNKHCQLVSRMCITTSPIAQVELVG